MIRVTLIAIQPNPIIHSQDQTTARLRERLASLGVDIELGTELASLDQDDSSVTVKLVKHVGDATEEETLKVEYVVGADGARGQNVRRHCVEDFIIANQSSYNVYRRNSSSSWSQI
jgi:2-polyprenyl-6-methoxyphenol hydroxylase-like FAD-dependent oxidoreductase